MVFIVGGQVRAPPTKRNAKRRTSDDHVGEASPLCFLFSSKQGNPPRQMNNCCLKLIPAFSVNVFYDLKRFYSFLRTWNRCSANSDIFKKLLELQGPGGIAARELIDDRLRRPHLRKHLVIIEPLHPVTAAQPFDQQLRAL